MYYFNIRYLSWSVGEGVLFIFGMEQSLHKSGHIYKPALGK